MKRIAILLICFVLLGILPGCGLDNNSKNLIGNSENTVSDLENTANDSEYTVSDSESATELSANTISEKTIVTKSTSPDGKYEVVSEVNEEQHIFRVTLSGSNGSKDFEIVGVGHSFLWSPDSTKVCDSYSGRIWGNFSIIDAENQTIIEYPISYDIINRLKAKGYVFDYELNENRPDPYYSPIEWSPDSKKLLVFYQWHDTDYDTQNGVFVYDLEKNDVSDLVQYEPNTEGGHVDSRKPEGFTW